MSLPRAAIDTRAMFVQQSRLIAGYAWPMLIAHLVSMGMPVIDTVLLGHHDTDDLAAVAVGGGIYITVILSLSGVAQAVSPIVAQLKGAGRDGELAGVLHQGFWLALLLSVPGALCLLYPDFLLELSSLEAAVDAKARAYLAMLAWGVPAVLLYRVFYAFCIAVGLPRPLMTISLFCTLIHGALASALVSVEWGGGGGAPLGVVGCGVSNALIAWLALAAGALYMRRGARLRAYRLFAGWRGPRKETQVALLRLGMPMGLSGFIEISAFTFIALFVARLGTDVVASHRIVANLAGVLYMLPLSLGLATLPCVGHAAGARDWRRARVSAVAGIAIATLVSALLGAALWLGRTALVDAYTDDPALRGICLSLIVYLVANQLCDAVQTVAAHALRGYKITFAPMLAHVTAFWGVGLLGGWWLALRSPRPMGISGFWLAMTLSLVFAAIFLGWLLWRVANSHSRASPGSR
ncbi:MAG: MATE family efflux transporter [Candidatus Accumulibacter sp.]|jgi:MATE family multidrug resistance protein|nr:MATE family efflux transporter [Accumulibacter sp.]